LHISPRVTRITARNFERRKGEQGSVRNTAVAIEWIKKKVEKTY
jgi:hypothetical protein